MATTLASDDHERFVTIMEVNQTNRTGIGLRRCVSVHGDSGLSNVIHKLYIHVSHMTCALRAASIVQIWA